MTLSAQLDDHYLPQVVLIAASVEGIDALARLVNQLPATFPIPIVAHIHGMRSDSMDRLTARNWRFPSRPSVVYAKNQEKISEGIVYVIPAEGNMVFTAVGILDRAANSAKASADHLFASAAHWYESRVIGVVLSGLGTEGTQGLRSITQTNGIRVVQSPYDAKFPHMPTSALVGDDVQYTVMLDQMGKLLQKLVVSSPFVEIKSTHIQTRTDSLAPAEKFAFSKSLERNIIDILNVVRQELVMDIAFVTQQMSDRIVIIHSTASSDEFTIQGVSFPKEQSLCQRVLDGRLPPVMPDVKALRSTHDVPDVPMAIGAYMAVPIQLGNGELYGALCCLDLAVSPKLGKLQHNRLKMSARQIARLVDQSGG